jgi:parallel beta helix pectate lyase-like protein/uncharacterized protein DUF1565
VAKTRLRLQLLVCVLAALTLAGSGQARDDASSPHADKADTGPPGSRLPRLLPPSGGRTFYVGTGGSDSNPGTRERPWRTIQRALNALRPGQRAFVRRGTYTQDLLVRRSGTRKAPITIAAYRGERVVLHAASTTGDTYPIRFTDTASYLRVRGFVIESARGSSSTNVYFEDRVHHIELVGNDIRFSQDQGIFSERTTSNLHILRNRIHENGLGHVSGQHQSHGIYIEGRDHLIANNVIYAHPFGFGIQIYPQNRGTIVVNNTVITSGHSGIVVGGDDGVSNITIRNNVLAFNQGYGVDTDDACPTSAVLVDTNVVYRNNNGSIDRGCAAVDVSGGNVFSDPHFVAPSGQNFQLRRDSPAVDRARPDFAPRTDIRGVRRPRGAGYDIGAYERGR